MLITAETKIGTVEFRPSDEHNVSISGNVVFHGIEYRVSSSAKFSEGEWKLHTYGTFYIRRLDFKEYSLKACDRIREVLTGAFFDMLKNTPNFAKDARKLAAQRAYDQAKSRVETARNELAEAEEALKNAEMTLNAA